MFVTAPVQGLTLYKKLPLSERSSAEYVCVASAPGTSEPVPRGYATMFGVIPPLVSWDFIVYFSGSYDRSIEQH